MSEKLEELISLLYQDNLTQYGKRLLVENIEKLQKENEELKRLMAHKNGYTKLLEEDLFENCSNYVIPIQKVKDKISERQFELQQEYKDFEDDAILIVLQELLEGRKENESN